MLQLINNDRSMVCVEAKTGCCTLCNIDAGGGVEGIAEPQPLGRAVGTCELCLRIGLLAQPVASKLGSPPRSHRICSDRGASLPRVVERVLQGRFAAAHRRETLEPH